MKQATHHQAAPWRSARRAMAMGAVGLGLGWHAAALAFCAGGGQPHLPQGPFVDAGNGLVRHVPSQTVWKRCAEGQNWAGKSCVGQPLVLTAAAAQARVIAVNASAPGTRNAGQTSWRLPRLHELRWLVEAGCERPAINQTQFPRTPVLPFWTETPFVDAYNAAWTVDFAFGEARGTSRLATAALRLVRVAAAPERGRDLALLKPPRGVSGGRERPRTPSARPAPPTPISDLINIDRPPGPSGPPPPYVSLLPPPAPTCP